LILFAVAGLGTPTLADDPATVPAPTIKVGDSWVFDSTVEKGAAFGQQRLDFTVERLDDDTMVLGIKRDEAPGPFEDHVVGQDWSHRLLADGEETVTTRPFSFPMSVGQRWSVDYVDSTRRGAQTSDHVRKTYKVVGWEDVTVPAGTFHAIKVEAHGVDLDTIQVPAAAVGGAVASSDGATSVSHTQRGGQDSLTRVTYAELYYVPKIKSYVKSIEEQYNADNIRLISETQVLVSYKLAS
jgi:hypothetical protein